MENSSVCLLCFVVLCMICNGYTSDISFESQLYENLKTPPSNDFSHHTIITPKIYHGREKRQISNTKEEDGQHTHFLTIGYTNDGSEQILDLQLNKELIPANFFVRYQENGKHVVNRPTGKDVELCHYVGVVRGKQGSWAAVSTCKGLKGVVYDGNTMHYLHPSDEDDLESAHYLYKHDHLVSEHKCGYQSGLHNDTHSHDHHHTSASSIPHATVGGGLNGNDEFNRILRYKRSARDEPKIRGPYNANKLSRYVELVLVVDNKEYKELGESVNNVYRHCKDISNIINSLYAPLNIFIALTGIVVWTEYDEIQLSDNGDSTLTNFLHYRREKLLKDHPNDNAQLLTREQFTGGVVGKALKGPICTFEFSGGVAMDHSNVVGLVATTVAHEMGHNFGMEHDTESCKCPDERCIMSPSSNSQSPTHWSSCSLEYLALAFEHGMDYCLRNKPTRLFDSPVCGNGFVEPGEQCDCGLSNSCTNNHCCDPATCMLFPNATCATGECCDLETCRPSAAGQLCRSADHECDLPEYCTGQSEFCPDDVFKMDSETCDHGRAFCYKGSCRTRNDQCRLLWGPSGESSDDQCYDMNKKGTRHGNCGYDRLKKHFNFCQDTNKFCGMLHCRHLNERLEFGMESVAILSHSFINSNGSIIPCRTAIVDLGLNQVDPGLVPDGAMCGKGKMCVNQKCMPVASLRMSVQSNTDSGAVCPSDCSGHGVCNSLGHCHCEKGFSPPLCKLPGPGGSLDSGPASDPNAQKQVTAGLLIFFLGIVPAILLITFFIYYSRHNSLIGWKKPKGPISKSPGKNGTRPSCFGLSSSPSPPSSTSPLSHSVSVPPMSPDDMNSSLLPSQSQMDSSLNGNFFGQFKGFALFPLQKRDESFGNQNYVAENEQNAPPTVSSFSPTSPNKTGSVKNVVNALNRNASQTAQINRGPSFTTPRSPTHKVPQRSAPPVPSVPTVAIHLKRANTQADNNTLDKLNNSTKESINRPKSVASGVENITTASVAPALPPLNPGLQSSRPVISNPILEGSTCTAKELVSPLKHCNKNNTAVMQNIPLRAAPSAPVTLPVPGATSPTSSKRPLSSPNSVTNAVMQIPEEGTLKKNKEGNTLNRITSFLKQEKDKSRNPVERSNSLPKNPNHVVKVHKNTDKNDFRKLPISNPILQKDIELPGNVVPVLSDSEDDSKINVTRAQSMRGPHAAPRPNISSFGSMRQPSGTKRPTSIAVGNRPTSPPPPIPVEIQTKSGLPMYQNQQKDIKMSEYADCIAETQAPLANINEETSPDNIYSIIEESPPIGNAKDFSKPKSTPASKHTSPENLTNVTAGSTDSMGLLGEIVSEIQNRNFDSIYSTSTLARKKKEKEERERKKQKEMNGDETDLYDCTTYANTSQYRSPEADYSNLSDGSKNISSAASTTSSGYLNPAAVNVPVGIIPPMSGIVSIGGGNSKTPPKPSDPPSLTNKADEVDKYKPFASTFHRSLGPFASAYTNKTNSAVENKNDTVTTPTNSTQKQFPSKVPLVRQNTPEKLLDKPNISRQITPPNLRGPLNSGVTLRNSQISKHDPADRLSSANSPDLVSSCAPATNSVKSPDVVNGNGSSAANKGSVMSQGVILKPSLQSLPAKPPPQPQKNPTTIPQKPLIKQNSKGSLGTSPSPSSVDHKSTLRSASQPPATNSNDKKKIVPPRPTLPKIIQNGTVDKNVSSNNGISSKSNSIEKNLSNLSKTNVNDVKLKQPVKPLTSQKTDSAVKNINNSSKPNTVTKASNVANLQQKFESSKVGLTNRAPIVSLKKV